MVVDDNLHIYFRLVHISLLSEESAAPGFTIDIMQYSAMGKYHPDA
jgi:hypothetical protein